MFNFKNEMLQARRKLKDSSKISNLGEKEW